MIIKVIHRANAKDALDYAGRAGKWATSEGPALEIAGNLPAGVTLDEWKREFSRVAALRPRISTNVVHIVIALVQLDRDLRTIELAEIAKVVTDRFGLADGPWRATYHLDGHTPHIHIIASLLDYQGQRIDMTGERYRAKRISRALELEHGLWRVGNRRGDPILPPLPRAGEVSNPHFEIPKPGGWKEGLRSQILEILKPGLTLPDLRDLLAHHGVDLVPKFTGDGCRINGLGFRVGGQYIKASDVDRSFSIGGLQKLGVTYESARDIPRLSPTPPPLVLKTLNEQPASTGGITNIPSLRLPNSSIPPPALHEVPHVAIRPSTTFEIARLWALSVWDVCKRPMHFPARLPSPGRHHPA
jgi:hypothetical protein